MTLSSSADATCRVLIVRQVGARNHDRTAPFSWRRIASPSSIGRLAPLISHHERNDGDVGQHAFEKRQLHLERVLAAMRGRMRFHHARRLREIRRTILGDRNRTERRLERSSFVERDAFEADVVRRTDKDGHVDVAAAQQAGTRGRRSVRSRSAPHAARRSQADSPDWRSLDGRKIPIDLARERLGIRGIPRSRHRRAAKCEHSRMVAFGMPGPADSRRRRSHRHTRAPRAQRARKRICSSSSSRTCSNTRSRFSASTRPGSHRPRRCCRDAAGDDRPDEMRARACRTPTRWPTHPTRHDAARACSACRASLGSSDRSMNMPPFQTAREIRDAVAAGRVSAVEVCEQRARPHRCRRSTR